MVLLVSYDLKNPVREYDDLYESLSSYESCHALESVWFLDTNNSPSDVRDELEASIDKDDVLFVVRPRKHWAGTSSLEDDVVRWLKSATRTW